MNSILSKIKLIFKEFGFWFLIKYLYSKTFGGMKGYITFVKRFLMPYNERALMAYNKSERQISMPKTVPIWIFWWQGYDNMPPICKCCYHSVKRHIPNNAELILLTKDNYSDYVNLSSIIIQKVEAGVYSITHLSDVLRNALISNYGGFWIDSTIYCTKAIESSFIEDSGFWSIKLKDGNTYNKSVGRSVTNCMWGSFIQKGPINSKINTMVYDALSEYMIQKNVLIDYFTQNFLISNFYDMDEVVRETIENIEPSNPDLYLLDELMNSPFKMEKWKDICEHNTFLKLSWKHNYLMKTAGGEDTFYAYIINECQKQLNFRQKS